jgi:hypothetical protein
MGRGSARLAISLSFVGRCVPQSNGKSALTIPITYQILEQSPC